MVSTFVSGFLLGFSLILAIGAQNAFVLKQGLRGEHVLAVVLTCALSDAVLIAAGVAGFGALLVSFPAIENIARYGGAAFLIFYGARSLVSALRRGEGLVPDGQEVTDLGPVIWTCLLLTWLNPHVYLDTVVLLGSISLDHAELSWIFGLGAMGASFAFFFMLGFGARLLRPLFAAPIAWRWLDGLVALVMFGLAISLFN